jgi:hypothetical protein
MAGSAGVPTGNFMVGSAGVPTGNFSAVVASPMTPIIPIVPMTPIWKSIDNIIDSRKKQAHDFARSSFILRLDEPVKLATIDR